MKGPKPNPAIAFRELYRGVAKLRSCCNTKKQHDIVDALSAGFRTIEPAWDVERKSNGELDLLATHPYNAPTIQSVTSDGYEVNNST